MQLTVGRSPLGLAVFSALILFANATLAAPKDSTDEAKANCANAAAAQLSMDTANCTSRFPTYSGAYADCMTSASFKYSRAITACAGQAPFGAKIGVLSGTRLRVVPTVKLADR